MLSKLVLINSCTYDLAEIDFSKGASMQLVGGNNVGKSSLIGALNFLFVINRRQMAFTGGRSADPETMAYYFPEAEGSFLVFEIAKRGRKYCLVVWRHSDKSPRYGRLDQSYTRESFFSVESAERLQPLTLGALRKKWLLEGSEWREISKPKEVYSLVYGAGRQNDAVVWLKRATGKNIATDFSKLYRYLIDTQQLDSQVLQEILLLADQQTDSTIEYRASDQADLDKLRNMSERTGLLSRHREAFDQLRSDGQTVRVQEQALRESVALFDDHCTRVRALLTQQGNEHEQLLTGAEGEWLTVKKSLGDAREREGGKKQSLRTANEQAGRIKARIATIKELPTPQFLLESKGNLEANIEEIAYHLRELSEIKEMPETIQRRMNNRGREIGNVQKQYDNCENWLIHHLADCETDRRRLYTLLHHDVALADKEHVLSSVTSTEGEVMIYDGRIALPQAAEEEELPTPEKLLEQLARLRQLQKSDGRILNTAKNQSALCVEGENYKQVLKTIAQQLQLQETLPDEEAALGKTTETVRLIEADLGMLRKSITQQTVIEKDKQQAVSQLKEEDRRRAVKLATVTDFQRRVGLYSIVTGNHQVDAPADDSLDTETHYHHLEQAYREWNRLQDGLEGRFKLLRSDLLSEAADIDAFFETMEQEYAGLVDKEAAFRTLVTSTSQHFAVPAASMLEKYTRFSDFISQQFNRGLKRVSISNIERLHVELVPNKGLQAELKQISSLNLGEGELFQVTTPKLKLLHQYIAQGRTIAFTDLFSLQLKLRVNGKEKTVDLGKQVESDGTDRMLRLIIVMQVISRLAVLGKENRLVIFIDEIATIDGKNRPQLVEFCREHHFYPIFAAPEMVDGFDRYVLITPAPAGRVVIEEDKHYIDVEPH